MSPADYRMIRVEALLPHPHNPRTDLGDPQKLAELANDIAENGNTIRLRVVPILEGKDAGKFLLIEGHRRTEAAKLGGVHELLCWVDPFLDTLALQIEAMLRENTHREGITASNEAKAIQTILECEGMSVKKVAKAIHRSESFIRKRSRLAGLPAVAHQLVDGGGLTLEQSDAFDEFKDDHESYQELILMATNPHRGVGEWDRLVKQLRTKRDAPVAKAASETLIKELSIPTLDRNQTYSGHYNRDYQADRRTDAEHAAAGEFAFINENSGQIEWYKKASSGQAPKTPPTEEEKEARRKLKDIEAGLEQDLAMWDEHLRRCLTDAGGGLPLTPAEKILQVGIAPNVLGSYPDYERACELILGKKYVGLSGGAIEVREAVARLRPLQLVMLMAELQLKPSQLHKPSTWDPTSYSWRESEGTARWLLVRNDVFNYPPAVFEREAMAHFTALKSKSTTAEAADDDQEEEDDDA
ncbi:UNVERIFIED_ORG: ParB/RepB/Spo0J family partition protein [Arthrobacter sp. UYEF1]